MATPNWTKIVVTLGPATDQLWTWNPETFQVRDRSIFEQQIGQMMDDGVQIFRFNLSHNDLTDHIFRARVIREYLTLHHRLGGLMFDTKGPELRVGQIQTGQVLHRGQNIKIYSNWRDLAGTAEAISVIDFSGTYNLSQDVRIGTKIYIEDGKLSLTVVEINPEFILAEVQTPEYLLVTNKRVNLYDTPCSLPFLSDYDIQCVQLAAELEIEYLAVSFVRNGADLRSIRKIIHHAEGKTKIIAKIETYEAIKNIDEIIQWSDGIMVARGDLALNIDYTEIPYQEEVIIQKCLVAQKPVIVATQMLDSMERNAFPTRAEIVDVYRATELGATALMLSGETAQGFSPILAVKTMSEIIRTAEKHRGLPLLLVSEEYNDEPGIYMVNDPCDYPQALLRSGVTVLKKNA